MIIEAFQGMQVMRCSFKKVR